jgi:hypothetical protein
MTVVHDAPVRGVSSIHGLRTEDILGLSEVASAANIKPGSLRVMLYRARLREREGSSLVTDVPEPCAYVGRIPLWTSAAVKSWVETRKKYGLTGNDK